MNLAKIFRADFGSDLAIRSRYGLSEKLSGFATLVRPIFLLMTPLNAASAAVLGIRGFPSWQLCLIGFITAAFAAAGVNTFNKYADRERDKIIWPMRSIPSGRVTATQALLLAIIYYVISLALCWFFFNPVAFGILLAAEILGSLYSSHLRDKVGYLSLPLIEGLIFLCGWACLSPDTVFTTFVPWYLYLLGVVWQSAHILAHYVLHIRYDAAGQPVILTPLLFSRPSPESSSRVTVVITILLFVMSVFLPLLTPLSWIYLAPAALFGIYAIYQCTVFLKTSRDTEKMNRAWSALSLFRMVISAGILVSVLVYH